MAKAELERIYAEDGVIYNLKILRDTGVFTKKAVAKMLNDGRLIKEVVKDEHYFRKYKGYAIADAILEEVKTKDCGHIVIKEYVKKGNSKVWNRTLVSELETWLEEGIGHKTEGYESQVVLPEEEMYINE